MSVETDVETLKKQVSYFLTRSQIETLVAALGSDHTTIISTLTTLAATLTLLQTEIQSLKDTIADHEARIAAIE